jgi:hypothetical protein
MNITCMKLIISYNGLQNTSMGSHIEKINSWFIRMQTAPWMAWNVSANDITFLVYLWMIGMYPAFVIFPVSGSLVGSSFHVKESVMKSRCSMSRLRYL